MVRDPVPAAYDPRPSSPDVSAEAIHLLVERGFDAMSVDDLAQALGVSRSTFFRRFGTKEDIVFVDHTVLLARIGDVMEEEKGDAFDAINRACLSVIGYHVSRPEATRERRTLLRSHPSLRERELVMAHRYERAFRAFLSAHLDSPAGSWVATAYASAAVAVHNDALRAWFQDDSRDAVRRLREDLTDLATTFRAHALKDAPSRARVVVAVHDTRASVEEIVERVRRAVEE